MLELIWVVIFCAKTTWKSCAPEFSSTEVEVVRKVRWFFPSGPCIIGDGNT